MRYLLIILLAAAGSVCAAEQKFNPQDLRKSFISDCVTRGLQRGADPDNTYRFCTCSFETMATNLTVSEYLEVDRVTRDGKGPQTLVQIQRIIQKLEQCKQ
ncbi:MAG: hypothetical protein AB9M53_06590 [Leptothrix sp. (in: b-proteobacteria)]